MRRGLTAGLPESPMSAVGRGIGEAFDTGLNAYATTKRIGLAERQDAREQGKFDMAKQLQPLQMQSAQLEVEDKQARVREAVAKGEREAQARTAIAGIMEKCKSGKCAPEDIQLDFVNFAVLTGDPAHIRQAFNDYAAVTEKGRIGEETRGMLTESAPLLEQAMRSRSVPDIMALQATLAKYPRAAGHGFVTSAGKMFETALKDTMPEAAAEAVREYAGMKAARPDLTPDKIWELTVGGNPQASAFFEQSPAHMPYEVRKGRKISETVDTQQAQIPGKVAEAAATAAVKEPIETRGAIERTRAAGEEQRKTEDVRQKNRLEVKKATTHAEAIALVKNAEDNLTSLRRTLKDEYDPEKKQDIQDQIAEETENLKTYRGQLQEIAGSKAAGATGDGKPGPRKENAPTAAPKGIRANTLKDARGQLGKSKDLAGSQRYLDHIKSQNHISQEEYDNLMATERRRFGGK